MAPVGPGEHRGEIFSDGLPDAVELYGMGAFGTDPLDPDSDGDEALDGFDNCPKRFYEETNQSGFNPSQSDLDGDGKVIKRFSPRVKPDAPEVVAAIESALKK